LPSDFHSQNSKANTPNPLPNIGNVYFDFAAGLALVKKLADVLETTVGYLLGETEDRELLKDPAMLRRLNDIAKFPEEDKNHILYALDAMIKNVKFNGLNT